MNVEIGTEAAQFPEKEYINGIFLAVWLLITFYILNNTMTHVTLQFKNDKSSRHFDSTERIFSIFFSRKKVTGGVNFSTSFPWYKNITPFARKSLTVVETRHRSSDMVYCNPRHHYIGWDLAQLFYSVRASSTLYCFFLKSNTNTIKIKTRERKLPG
jgi:hypothetical protein